MKSPTTLRLLAIVALSQLASACASWTEYAGAAYVDERSGIELTPPPGWFQPPYKGPRGMAYFTRDGILLQEFHVGRVKHKNAFPAVEKDSAPGMLPETLAEHYIADLTAYGELENLSVLSNEPATLGGREGFRLELEYRVGSGLRYREIHYCAATDAGFYVLVYSAPVLHYFDRDLAAFDRVYASMRIQ